MATTLKLFKFCFIFLLNFELTLTAKVLNVTGGFYEKNKVMESFVVKASDLTGPKGCVRECMMYTDCNAVNFDMTRSYCELLDVAISDDETINNSNEVYFTNISDWTKDEDACWPNNCPPKTRCIVGYGNLNICIPFETPCDNNLCKNDAVCINSVKDYSCRCLPGFYGQYCELTPCSSGPCKNDGTCSFSGPVYTCTCKPGFYGNICQFTPCHVGPCVNNGTCSVSGSTYSCACPLGYYGTDCECKFNFH
ncbi:uncharacterized protein LOC143053433 [Mytilus galloprovincialis]|uniref:uncharacterized protein LOC143053433 n=1 Tax=Mytilus galloprovincialis TaxID=29158 RepID=UPI003F7B98B0